MVLRRGNGTIAAEDRATDRQARQQQKNVERQEREQKKAAEREAREQQKSAEREAAALAQAEKAFRESPVGQATTAHEAGAGFFQVQLEVSEVARSFWRSSYQGYSVAERSHGNHADALSEIEAVGWRLEHVGYPYVMTGQVSRDKLLSSGQEVGVMGKVVGIYLFRRTDEPRTRVRNTSRARGTKAATVAQRPDPGPVGGLESR